MPNSEENTGETHNASNSKDESDSINGNATSILDASVEKAIEQYRKVREGDKDLTEKEGYDPSSDEYYAEVDKRMRVDFPHKFGNTENKQTTAPVQTVASATRSVKPGRKTVRLTSSQVAIAKKLGVPLEEYAKQLKNTEGA